MLGLRLDEPLPLAGLEESLDPDALERLERLGLASARSRPARADAARPLPRRRRDGAPARVTNDQGGPAPTSRACLPWANGNPALQPAARHPPARRRGVRRDRPAGRLEERSSSATGIGVSSSTVRHELAELERIGLLTHPHTSAGRIPTEAGYRLYVDELLSRPEPGRARLPARPARRCGARSRRRSRRRPRCSPRSRGCSRSSRRRRSRRRPSGTSRCCCSSRTS